METIHHIKSSAEISSVIVNGIAVFIIVPIIVSVIVSILFTTSIHVHVLPSSLQIQYTILRATTRKLDTDKICNDLNGNMCSQINNILFPIPQLLS